MRSPADENNTCTLLKLSWKYHKMASRKSCRVMVNNFSPIFERVKCHHHQNHLKEHYNLFLLVDYQWQLPT